MNEIECESCIKRKTIYCPSSSECYDTVDKPYYQNRIMLLKENQQLKEKLEASEKARKILKEINEYRKETGGYPSEMLDKLLDILDIDK